MEEEGFNSDDPADDDDDTESEVGVVGEIDWDNLYEELWLVLIIFVSFNGFPISNLVAWYLMYRKLINCSDKISETRALIVYILFVTT